VSTDFTATTGTTVVLTNPCTLGDAVVTESFYVSSVLNAIPATASSVSDSYIVGMSASKLTGTQTIPKATLPTGSVLQVVQASYSTSTTNSTNTYSDTGLTASITPTSSSSKILVIVAQQGVVKVNSDTKINIKLFRNATDLTVLANAGATNSSAVILIGSATIVYLDSPATTSSTTYKTQFNSSNNTSYVGVQDSNVPSTITLIEISA
jgi:hypothetical protein